MTKEDSNNTLLLLERKKYYLLENKQRPNQFNDLYLLKIAADFIQLSVKSRDWRFLNLALKINDSAMIKADKKSLKNNIKNALTHLKKQLL